MTSIINLQNTPVPASVTAEAVSFTSNGVELKGILYKPADADSALGAAIVTGAWTTVKEQMSGTYGVQLAMRGLIALTFDFMGWGESSGKPRYVEDPAVKTADIHAAVEFLASRDDVDKSNISGLGICASSGYMAEAVADNDKLQKLTLVAPWLHDEKMAEGIYGGPETVAKLIETTEEAKRSDNPAVLTAASATDDTAPMYQAPYYTEEHRGLISEYDNKFSVLTWKPWLTYDAQASADRITKPVLMVGSEGIALPTGAETYETRTKAPIEKLWLDGDANQFDFYDREDVVVAASDAVAKFFQS